MLLSALAILWSLFCATGAYASSTPLYTVADRPVPVFSTPDISSIFGRAGGSLRLDKCGQIQELEFIALPGTAFIIEEVVGANPAVYRVTTADYPYPAKSGGYYLDSRLVTVWTTKPAERRNQLPAKEKIVDRLLAARGSSYVWGGNVREGVSDLLRLYPPAGREAGEASARRQLQGVDCSGLLYEATEGFTPRNTSGLVSYGTGITIAGHSVREIAAQLQPLDLIVWDGHVIIVLDRERVIESRLVCGKTSGVMVSPLDQRLGEVMTNRSPVNDYRDRAQGGKGKFVVRRWYEVRDQ